MNQPPHTPTRKDLRIEQENLFIQHAMAISEKKSSPDEKQKKYSVSSNYDAFEDAFRKYM
jgi:hypothetical protein